MSFPYLPPGDAPGLLCGLSTWEDSPGSPEQIVWTQAPTNLGSIIRGSFIMPNGCCYSYYTMHTMHYNHITPCTQCITIILHHVHNVTIILHYVHNALQSNTSIDSNFAKLEMPNSKSLTFNPYCGSFIEYSLLRRLQAVLVARRRFLLSHQFFRRVISACFSFVIYDIKQSQSILYHANT